MEQFDFATRLRLARGRAGLSIEALAEASGISPTQIGNLENGRVQRPRIQTLGKLAAALKIPIEDLMVPAGAAEAVS